MLIQNNNNPPTPTQSLSPRQGDRGATSISAPQADSPRFIVGSSNKGVDTQQPVLVLQVGSHLDPGLRRKDRPNEDSIFVTQGIMPSASVPPKPFAFIMVADGVGGHMHGQEASQLAVQSLVEFVSGSLRSQQMRPEAFLPLLRAGVQYANQIVFQRNQEQRVNMGTTMTATLVVDTTAYVAHVGDSRCYLYHKPTGLSQITQDHSVVAALVAAGVIQPEDIYTHPSRNLIYRCLGEKSSVEVDCYAVPLAAGDILLLCSDGLWEMVRDQQIAAILTAPMPTPSDTAHSLIQAALAGGGEDNVSAIVARCATREHGPESGPPPKASNAGRLFISHRWSILRESRPKPAGV